MRPLPLQGSRDSSFLRFSTQRKSLLCQNKEAGSSIGRVDAGSAARVRVIESLLMKSLQFWVVAKIERPGWDNWSFLPVLEV